jgi:hypothetical protein
MNDAHQQTPEGPGPLPLPKRTTPTWEIELLISGAVVFSLFSLHEPLEAYFQRSFPVATEVMQPLVMYSYLYGKLVLFVLLITFVLHLVARARWVALVGVHSIYPHGPRWENQSGGPIARKLSMRDVGDIDEAIERADNHASLVFGYGLLAAQLSLMIMLVSLVSFGAIALLRAAGVPKDLEIWLVAGLVLLLVLPMIADKYLVPRLGEQHWFSRGVEGLLRATFVLTLSRAQQPLNSLLTTNLGGKRGAWVLIAVIYVVLGLATFDTMARLDVGPGIRGRLLPEISRDLGLLANHYADSRDGKLRSSGTPFIDSAVVHGPYLRLVIPYQATRHDAAINRACPEVAPDAAADSATRIAARRAAAEARTRCFGTLFDVRLNGATPPGLEFHRYQAPDGGPDGVISLIDVRDLPRGRHTLSLAVVNEADGAEPTAAGQKGDDESEDDLRPHLIEFWR